MTEWLIDDELILLTAAKRFSAQRRRLDTMGIPYISAHNGRPLVSRDTIGQRRKPRAFTPNWEALHAKTAKT